MPVVRHGTWPPNHVQLYLTFMCSLLAFIHDNLLLRTLYWSGVILTGVFIIRKTGWNNFQGTAFLSLLWFLFWPVLGIVYLDNRRKRARP